jgi:hypothetical protein
MFTSAAINYTARPGKEDVMESFGKDRVDDIIRYVVDCGGDMTVQEKGTGHALSIFEDHSNHDKETIIKEFCGGHSGPFHVFSTKSCE